MVDDLKDIGGEVIFPLPTNWAKAPTNFFTITRYLNQFAGTSQSMSTLNLETPISFEALLTIFKKVDEYTLLNFIHSRKGRAIRFWIPYQKEMFTLINVVSIGSDFLNCVNNGAQPAYLGYERIYILLKTGDLITRHVTNVTSDTNGIILTLATPMDRTIGLDDYLEIGRFLLVRFDSDTFEFDVDTNNIFTFTTRFYELVKEYAELASD